MDLSGLPKKYKLPYVLARTAELINPAYNHLKCLTEKPNWAALL